MSRVDHAEASSLEERRERLLRALAELNDAERRAYLRGARDGCSYQAIAAELDVTVATIEQLTASALLKLRRTLDGPDAPEARAGWLCRLWRRR